MEYPLSEIIDRLSILMLKCERFPKHMRPIEERDRFLAAFNEMRPQDIRKTGWLVDQTQINGLIWDLEAAIRQGKEGELGLEEVGRRAIRLRDLNAERVRRKNQIAQVMGEYREVKHDHASAVLRASPSAA